MPEPLVRGKPRKRNKDGTWRKKRFVPGAERIKVVNAILARIAKKREAVQLILSKEFDEPPINFYDLADRIARECEKPINVGG